MTIEEVRIVQTTIIVPLNLFNQFKLKVKEEGLSNNEAINSLIYNYVNDVYKK